MAEENLEVKVRNLEKSLDGLKSEVDRKMKIMEQILHTRNEQFAVHKKLIEEEQALYRTVISHWGTCSDPSSSEHLHFAPSNVNVSHYFQSPSAQIQQSSSIKRPSGNHTLSPSQRRRFRAKRSRNVKVEKGKTEPIEDISQLEDWESNNEIESSGSEDSADDTEAEIEEGLSGAESGEGDNDLASSGLEKRVFINYFVPDAEPNSEQSSSDPVWNYFLREEQGTAALCKYCDEKGFQQIYKLKTPSLGLLRRHMKQKHKIIVEVKQPPEPEPVDIKDHSVLRKITFLRHQDQLYTRYAAKSLAEFWRCRDRTCGGRLVNRNGDIHVTREHSCLTNAADCDAILFREKIRELARANPTLPTSDIISAAKEGHPDDILQLIPMESLRRTIRRIRQTLQTEAEKITNTFEWT